METNQHAVVCVTARPRLETVVLVVEPLPEKRDTTWTQETTATKKLRITRITEPSCPSPCLSVDASIPSLPPRFPPRTYVPFAQHTRSRRLRASCKVQGTRRTLLQRQSQLGGRVITRLAFSHVLGRLVPELPRVYAQEQVQREEKQKAAAVESLRFWSRERLGERICEP